MTQLDPILPSNAKLKPKLSARVNSGDDDAALFPLECSRRVLRTCVFNFVSDESRAPGLADMKLGRCS